MRRYDVPGAASLEIEHLVLDLNGTVSDRGSMIDGVGERLERLSRDLEIHLATADTRGTAGRLAATLPLSLVGVSTGADKADLLRRVGAGRTAAIGNGRNDVAMLRLAVLGIAIIGPEGVAAEALQAADVACRSIIDALDLLIDERAVGSTLRP